MLNRRSFFNGIAALGMVFLLSGCNRTRPALKILLLANSIPSQSISKFRKSLTQKTALSFKAEAQLQQLYDFLEDWREQGKEAQEEPSWIDPLIGFLPFVRQRTPKQTNLITLGHSWLSQAIQNRVIQPLNPDNFSQWKNLPSSWQDLVRRNSKGQLDPSGEVWGAPYRWGTTAIAYNRDKFKALDWELTDWSDLWRPELRDRVSIIDRPREVIGLTLKKLGYSYNEENLSKIANLKSELRSLHQQIKFYSSTHYLQPLILEDVWVAVGWSADILSLQEQYPNIDAIIPQSGTALWADLWVEPSRKNAPSSEAKINTQPSLENQWIDFCWREETALQIALFTPASSPIILGMNRANLLETLQNDPLRLPNAEIIAKSDFIEPLSKEIEKQYRDLWKTIMPNVDSEL
ncbi:extracellular solute-binding protein [Lusitaniella coriacea]|uniref:extracellular solute-binding protein n=1 Tax=Lusitaniella coriacea TaxID=1983105 RepID=UPI003CEFF0AC